MRQYAKESGLEIDVLALPVSVAVFLTPEFVAGYLKSRKVNEYDLILMPGAMQGDVTLIEKATGIPTFKGPIHAADIALSFQKGVELSTLYPVSNLNTDVLRNRVNAEIEEVTKNWRQNFEENGGLLIGSGRNSIPISLGLPMPVIAEIVNAPNRDLNEIAGLARYYEEAGANIIDIGMFAGSPKEEKVPALINTIKDTVDLPVSIDTLNDAEIKAAVDVGVDLILSLDAGNMESVAEELSDTPVVILPSNLRRGELASNAETRVANLIKNIEKAKGLGFTKIIADPVVEPPLQPGLMNSLTAYNLFREKDKTMPVLFGLGNVTELIDVDSVGVNGLLTALAYEVEANILFTPEFSNKAKGSVRELVTASKMMFLAKRRKTTPKDLGIDLLILKEKRLIEDPRIEKPGLNVLRGTSETDFTPDKKGWFKIQIDRRKKTIEAVFYRQYYEEPEMVITGANATEIYQTIIRENLIGIHDHAAYLGSELQKAEIALKLGRSYIQDKPLF